MKTSNFANNARYNLGGISISRYPATRQGFKGPEFPPLFPSSDLLQVWKAEAITWDDYAYQYRRQLDCLNPQAIWDELMFISGASMGLRPEPIILCYESAKTLDAHPCHRRLVADWLERELDVDVPEWAVSA